MSQTNVITTSEATTLLGSGDGAGYSPLGTYLVRNHSQSWTAIDNSDGYAWCEDFANVIDAVGFLFGSGYKASRARVKRLQAAGAPITDDDLYHASPSYS